MLGSSEDAVRPSSPFRFTSTSFVVRSIDTGQSYHRSRDTDPDGAWLESRSRTGEAEQAQAECASQTGQVEYRIVHVIHLIVVVLYIPVQALPGFHAPCTSTLLRSTFWSHSPFV